MSLKAILFDYGKVLCYPPTSDDWVLFAGFFGVSVPEFQQPYWDLRDDYDRAVVDAPKYWRNVAAHLKKPISDALIPKLIANDNRQWTNANPHMVEFARRAKQAGLRIGILSNMQFDMVAALRQKFPWLNEFDTQIYTCEVGVIKPEPESYLISCRALGVQPSEVLFLDDKQVNIDGAAAVGMKTLLFQGDHEALYPLLEQYGVPLTVTE